MRCLMINNNKGYFLRDGRDQIEIDKISKKDILNLLDLATNNEVEFEMDEIQKDNLANQSHRIIYEHLYKKFDEILKNRDRFYDESSSIYKEALEKYGAEE